MKCKQEFGDILSAHGSELITRFSSYLSDESHFSGEAERIFFPADEYEIAAIMKEAVKLSKTVTISAGRTGLTGGAIPKGGWIISVERMNEITGIWFDRESSEFRLRVGPGVSLNELRQAVRSGHFRLAEPESSEMKSHYNRFRHEAGTWFFPPDPTETSARIGGMAATNASGACSFRYGSMRNHVRSFRVVLGGGKILEIIRGKHTSGSDGKFRITDESGLMEIPAPTYRIPDVKHACGYYSSCETDLADIFLGSEGTLGIFTSIEIALKKASGIECEAAIFFNGRSELCNFVSSIRSAEPANCQIESIEYLDRKSLNLIGHILPWQHDRECDAVFLGFRINGDPASALEELKRIIIDCGGNFHDSLAALGFRDLERFKTIRHSVPEKINSLVAKIRERHPEITKLGTDISVPDAYLEEIMEIYCRKLSERKLEHYIFGHIGNNHLHVNIIPHTPEQYAAGRELYGEFALYAVKIGGSVSAEHGIGKLKKYLLRIQFDDKALSEMIGIKKSLDPHCLLGPQTLFDIQSNAI